MPQNSLFRPPPGHTDLASVMPARAGSVPEVDTFHIVQQFRLEFPEVAQLLDSMRSQA